MIDYTILNRLFPNKLDAKRWASYINVNPVPYKPIVSQFDAKSGFIQRYFVKYVNSDTSIVEVSKTQYQKFKKNPRFATAEVKWKIIGKKQTEILNMGVVNRGVEDYNKHAVSKTDLTFGGLGGYITDYTEFWVSET